MKKITLEFKNQAELDQHKAAFIKDSGFLISAQKNLDMGTDVELKINLLDEKQKLTYTGKVVWITPQSSELSTDIQIGLQLKPQTSS